MLTIETITEEQIKALQAEAAEAGDTGMVGVCNAALRPRLVGRAWSERARQQCCDVINDARAQDEA
jgi:hypothetical protein